MTIKTCPFCGLPGLIKRYRVQTQIVCEQYPYNCGGATRWHFNLDEATTEWNRRVQIDIPPNAIALSEKEIRASMTSEQIRLERKLTCEAIDGAIAFGRQGTNPPPSDDHWLAPFWKIGRDLAALPALVSEPIAYWQSRYVGDPRQKGPWRESSTPEVCAEIYKLPAHTKDDWEVRPLGVIAPPQAVVVQPVDEAHVIAAIKKACGEYRIGVGYSYEDVWNVVEVFAQSPQAKAGDKHE